MIIFIIAAVLTIVLTALSVFNYHNDNEAWLAWSILDTFSTIVLAVCVVFIIIANTTTTHLETVAKYNATVTRLQHDRDSLLAKLDSSNELSIIQLEQQITAYNKDVEDFFIDVETHKIYASSPWINWYICPVYLDLEVNANDYYISR